MKRLSKINLKDIIDKQSLNVDELSKLVGGTAIEAFKDGCGTGVCNNNRKVGTQFCDDAVCSNGVGECNDKT